MKQIIEFWIASGIALCTLTTPSLTRAQIVPDATLPVNSNVTPDGNTSIITGGTVAGGNLFHSFEQFSVPTGNAAHFNNAPNIQNIISRVTGSSNSNIDGLIQANGTANLFLLNPNGITFGPNATLAIGGSILGSTASSLNFADGTHFSATGHPTTPLLTISVPIGLQFGATAGTILNQSRAIINSSGGLQVSPGKTLALVGGDVRVDGGVLQAPGGRVELGGVAGAGTVALSIDDQILSLSFPPGVQRTDVSLNNQAEVRVADSGGGSIAVNARNLEMRGGSSFVAGIGSGLGSVGAIAGNIEINATDQVTIAGTSPTGLPSSISNLVPIGSIGNGGDINITTESLELTDGARLDARTQGQGDAGSVTIYAGSNISFDEVSNHREPGGVFSSVADGAVGKAGDINITTESLELTNGAQLAASTQGTGDAGSVTIQAGSTISFEGESSDGKRSGAFSSVDARAVGKAGDIHITTGSLDFRNGAVLSARNFGQGIGGNVTIKARDTISFYGESSDGSPSAVFSGVESVQNRIAVGDGGGIDIMTGSLDFRNGARLSARTQGQGDASSVTIHARSTISFDGESKDGTRSGAISEVANGAVGNGGGINITTGSLELTNGALLSASTKGKGNAGSVTIIARDNISFNGKSSDGERSGAFSSVDATAVGDGGGIDITTGSLWVINGARLSASSAGNGAAGNIEVAARSIRLDNKATLRSDTRGGQGNIILNSQDLVLRRGSNITAKATRTATGGNITIDTGVLAALENSDISANAAQGSGGRIIINAQGIFGTQFRNQPTSLSDITATSDLGPEFSGIVEINTLDIDPSHGLVNLPAVLTEAEVAQTCQSVIGQDQSEFVITGRGGLPPNPRQALSSDAVEVDLVTLNPEIENSSSPAQATNQTAPEPALVEAQGWVIGSNGEVILTAKAPTVTPHSPWQTPAHCRAASSQERT